MILCGEVEPDSKSVTVTFLALPHLGFELRAPAGVRVF